MPESEFSIKKYSTSYALATKIFKAKFREPIYRLYEFVREADECVDSNPQDINKLLQIKYDILNNTKSQFSSVNNIQKLALNFEIPKDYILDFLAAMEKDFNPIRIEDYEELKKYMHGSAVVIGYMICHILNEAKNKKIEAAALGEAFQLTNFLRDVREDYLERNRVYLPKKELTEYKINLEQIFKEPLKFKEDWENFIYFQTKRVKQLYDLSLEGVYSFSTRNAIAILTAHQIYESLLNKIIDNPFLVLSKRLRVSNLEKYVILIKSIFKILCHKIIKKLPLL